MQIHLRIATRMALPVSTTVIRNVLGYLQCEISGYTNQQLSSKGGGGAGASGKAGNIGTFVSMKI